MMFGLGAWLLRRRLNQELQKELQFHIDAHAQDLMVSGVSADEANRRARIELGGLAQTAERVRDGRPDAWLDHLVHDFRDALHSLRRTPGLTAAAVTLIALVIGSNTTVFSIIHGILTKPAPGVQAAGLVTLDLVVDGRPYNGGNSYPNYLDYAADSATIRPLLVDYYERFTLTTADGSYALRGDLVSTNYFETLGVRSLIGRTFVDDDDRLEAAGLAAVVSERVWQRQFAGAAHIIGQTIALNGHAATIIGVAPPRFAGAVLGASSDVWVPLIPYSRLNNSDHKVRDRSNMSMGLFGRLVPHTSLSQAQAEFAAISRRLQIAYPETNRGLVALPIAYCGIVTGSLLSRQGSYLLGMFSVITLLTVLIVCANVANLMLARAAVRQREMALRQSLGASRVRIVRMLLTEGTLVSLVACVVAYLSAIAVSSLLGRLLPPDPSGTTFSADFAPDWKVAAYAMALSCLGTIAFTLAPAMRAWHQEVLPWLKTGEHGAVRGRSRVSSGLVVMQLAFSVLLLTSAGLAYRSLMSMNRLELGFNTNNLLLASVNTSGSVATAEANRDLLEKLIERVSAIPGVRSVSHVRWIFGRAGEPIRLHTTDWPFRAIQHFIGPGYLEVLGLSPLVGHEFARREGRGANPGAVINQRLAQTLWPRQSAIGQTMLVGSERQTMEIVGVAPNAFFNGFSRDPEPNFVFRSERQEPGTPGETTFYIRYAGSFDAAASALRRALREVDPKVPVASVRTMDTQLDFERWPVRAMITLLTIFAIGSLMIAVIGQYAVVAFSMRCRTRDFGVRMALGASPQHILSSVLGEGLRMTVFGLLCGCALSLAAATALRSLFYGISPIDGRTYLTVFVALAAASLAACYLPARRATHIEPIQALRHE